MTGIKLEAANLTALAERLSAAAPAKLWIDNSPVKRVITMPSTHMTSFFTDSARLPRSRDGFIAETSVTASTADKNGTSILSANMPALSHIISITP